MLIHPLETELGWPRDGITFYISIGLLLFGARPRSVGWLITRFGPRRLMIFGLVVGGVSAILSARMTALWQFNLLWGVLSGIGTGVRRGARRDGREPLVHRAARAGPRHLRRGYLGRATGVRTAR